MPGNSLKYLTLKLFLIGVILGVQAFDDVIGDVVRLVSIPHAAADSASQNELVTLRSIVLCNVSRDFLEQLVVHILLFNSQLLRVLVLKTLELLLANNQTLLLFFGTLSCKENTLLNLVFESFDILFQRLGVTLKF